MKRIVNGMYLPVLITLSLIIILPSCDKKNDDNDIRQTQFNMVDLVGSNSTYTGARVDPNLVNGWGIAFSPTGNAWISSEDMGVSTVYTATGEQALAAVSIPSPTGTTGGHPTGVIYNATSDFALTGGGASKFIFAGVDGTISAWGSGTAAQRIINNSTTSAYTGIAMASDGGANFVYAANFKSGKVDVFDKNFAMVTTKPFTDANIPAGYAPFNIQNIDGKLYVTYAKVGSDGEEEKGAGLGYVDVYNPDGTLDKRFTSQGQLNAPWAVVKAPEDFFDDVSQSTILIGNFGDGRINAYKTDGTFLSTLQKSGGPLELDGLWGLSFAPSTATGISSKRLFFAAGPQDEADGLFGYIEKP